MKTYLLPESGSFYKANLHCHSTVSDGKWTVEEIKKNYMSKGYSVIAYTDHGIFVNHNDLAEDGFLPLNGYEIDITNKAEWKSPESKTCHMCLIALDGDKVEQRIAYRSKHLEKNMDIAHIAEGQEIRRLEYTPEVISGIMREAVEEGFFVTYNHPVWSLETKDEYCSYHGMNAMEIVNFGCVCVGNDDRNGHEYDDMLRGGERIFCIATDDNHDAHPMGSPYNDSFGGFTMIKADRLTYGDITKALKDGSFYASEGPEINELWFEDGRVHITCSEAVKVAYTTGMRRAKAKYPEDTETITEADFEVRPTDVYFRITVYDKSGKAAYTNAYFVDELPL